MAEKNLNNLLANMSPVLSEETYVFVCLAPEAIPAEIVSFGQIREEEGVTLIVSQPQADQYHLLYDHTFARITLQVHSDLEAVGLTAAVSSRLAQAGISANMIAGFYHDHIFVPADLATKAMTELNSIAND